jgi:hypothetical protein
MAVNRPAQSKYNISIHKALRSTYKARLKPEDQSINETLASSWAILKVETWKISSLGAADENEEGS